MQLPLKIAENKYGIDPVKIAINFMDVLDGHKMRQSYDRFKSYLVSQIKRGITDQEEFDLAKGILNYVKSEPGSDERLTAIKYLFELQFLN